MLHPCDPAWPGRARRLLVAVERALEPLEVSGAFERTGSTSVPGLVAEDRVDLQVVVGDLPPPERLDPALATAGLVTTAGSRPDSPGVVRDLPRGSEPVPEAVARAPARPRPRRPGRGDPARPADRVTVGAPHGVVPRLAARPPRGP